MGADRHLSGWAEAIERGEPRAVAKAISAAENRSREFPMLLKRLHPMTGESLVIGVTGAPGTGKSTLVDRLIGHFRSQGHRTGVLAVDPSSPFTGGALLGDRIRMMGHGGDESVFIRSLATRGSLGGVCRAVGPAICVLRAAGMDRILIETVGAGQDEVDVVKYAEIVLLILTPGGGDDIQGFKAGIMEIADIYVVNKADLPQADRVESELRAMLEMSPGRPAPPSVVPTVAATGRGLDRLVEEIDRLAGRKERGGGDERRLRMAGTMLLDAVSERIRSGILESLPAKSLEELSRRIADGELDPISAAEDIFRKWREREGGT